MGKRRIRSVDDVILNILDDINRPKKMESSFVKTLFYTQVNNYMRYDPRDRKPSEEIFKEIKRVFEDEGYNYHERRKSWYFER